MWQLTAEPTEDLALVTQILRQFEGLLTSWSLQKQKEASLHPRELGATISPHSRYTKLYVKQVSERLNAYLVFNHSKERKPTAPPYSHHPHVALVPLQKQASSS